MLLPKYRKTVKKAVMPFAVVLFWIGIVIVLVCGWFLNVHEIYQLVSTDNTITGMLIFRCIGIFIAPLGGVLGWI